ncbi:MAG TPA: primosomal protein N' [bacterium]|nr:primosomal protein N' [bacterium]
MKYAKIAVFANIDNLLTYDCGGYEPSMAGKRAIVPLGSKLVSGLITGPEDALPPGFPESKIKKIKEIIDVSPALPENLIKLGLFIADYYICAPGMVFSSMLAPLKKVRSKKTVKLISDAPGPKGFTDAQRMVIDYLKTRRGRRADIRDIMEFGVKQCAKTVKELEESGNVTSEETAALSKSRTGGAPPDMAAAAEKAGITLNPGQQSAYEEITGAVKAGLFKTFALFGVTGSGKTEIYLRAAKEAVSAGKKVIVLVPEIFLTPQLTESFLRHFKDRTAVYHSGLSEPERRHEWQRIRDGGVDIVVGTRSAIFAPFDKAGLIIVDEEFDQSYKQENDPRYNAKDMAVVRGTIDPAVVVLGSATPSVETYHNAVTGKYAMLKLDGRVEERPLPEVEVIDLKYDLNKSRDLFFSNEFIAKAREALDRGEQAIIFLNRRGFSSLIMCPQCGHIEKCGSCDIPLVYHRADTVVKCHYCASEKEPPVKCPSCGKTLFYKGLGTQKIEDVAQKFFPEKKVFRVDIDSMKQNDHVAIYEKIKNREIDLLVGTQMIAKGFDFPEVTFVGVAGIDSVLNLPDFRAEERVFQLLTQVSGRAGRGGKPGKVVIQTFNPESSGIRAAAKNTPEKFYEEQLRLRREHGYPPFKFLLQFIVSDMREERCAAAAEKVRETAEAAAAAAGVKSYSVLGPAPAPLSRIRNRFRYSVIIKSPSRKDLNTMGRAVKKGHFKAVVSIIMDPVSTL